MKKLFICLLSIVSLFSVLGLSGCGKGKNKVTQADVTLWLNGMSASSTIDDNYTYNFTGEIIFTGSDGATTTYEADGKESRNGNKFYSYNNEYEVLADGTKQVQSEELYAIKLVDDNGTTRTKRLQRVKQHDGSGNDKSNGYFVAPNEAEEEIEYSPSQIFNYKCLSGVTTYDEIKNAIQTWMSESENEQGNISFTFKKNTDKSLALKFTISCTKEYTDYEDDLCNETTSESHEFVIKNNALTKYTTISDEKYNYPNNASKNYTEKQTNIVSYSYNDFDETYYNSIDMTTENNYYDYVGRVDFYYNGYLYNTSMYVPVGDSFDADDVKNCLVEWDNNCNYNTLIGRLDYSDPDYDDVTDEEKAEWIKESQAENAKFMSAMELFVDAEMTIPFTNEMTINESDQTITIYIKLTAPQDDAWVISVVPSRYNVGVMFVRFIQDCAHQQDGSLTFDSNSRLSAFPVVSVDGGAPSADGKYTFEKGTVHIFVCENI